MFRNRKKKRDDFNDRFLRQEWIHGDYNHGVLLTMDDFHKYLESSDRLYGTHYVSKPLDKKPFEDFVRLLTSEFQCRGKVSMIVFEGRECRGAPTVSHSGLRTFKEVMMFLRQVLYKELKCPQGAFVLKQHYPNFWAIPFKADYYLHRSIYTKDQGAIDEGRMRLMVTLRENVQVIRKSITLTVIYVLTINHYLRKEGEINVASEDC